MAIEAGGLGEDGPPCEQVTKGGGAASPSTSAASSSTGEEDVGASEARGMCLSSSSSDEELVLEQASMVNQKSGKRRRRRKRKRKKKNSQATSPQELELIAAAGQTRSPSGESDEVISLASDFGRDGEGEVIHDAKGDELANRTLWRVRRWATEMVSESETSSTSSDVELQSDLEEDGQRTPRWTATAAHGTMSEFLWGMGCEENTGAADAVPSERPWGLLTAYGPARTAHELSEVWSGQVGWLEVFELSSIRSERNVEMVRIKLGPESHFAYLVGSDRPLAIFCRRSR
ncbi:hypothetical protein FOL47_005177 [Perkinsus chesapeaki]|uniref:Uncharacterized protein n=1 Tax=Perkinsus chesapeaki TaxID=330153 RepID=A0A7J6MZ71_PERCH|nr:hypothetical protein FOL47_005177 [Perkinsus chesapeaki]